MILAHLVGCLASIASLPPAAPPCDGLAESDGFDFPVGRPDARGYYDAQPFGRNDHLGNDWNGVGGGDTDFGDPVFAAAAGRVVSVHVGGPGWGQVVRIEHLRGGACVESLSAHLSRVDVAAGELVARGDLLGAIGDADGRYWAHLHFELRSVARRPLGAGYGLPDGHVDATAFILANRPVVTARP
jgi:murein DD-endopeptidase MepM/ murein hydrolase activator NlpD